MKIADRLFARLLTRLTLLRATRHSDLAADLAAAHGADLADTMSDIDRRHRQLKVKIERVQSFVDDYSIDVPGFAQAQHMSGRIDEANDEWQEIRQRGLEATVDYRDYDISKLKSEIEGWQRENRALCDSQVKMAAEHAEQITRLRDRNAALAGDLGANAEELERFHAWALKLSGLQAKGNPSHATVREQVSKNFELLKTQLNAMTLDLQTTKTDLRRAQITAQAELVTFGTWLRALVGDDDNTPIEAMRDRVGQARDRLREALGSEYEATGLPTLVVDIIVAYKRAQDTAHASSVELANTRSLLSKMEKTRDRLHAQAHDFGADETQQTISTWAADTFGPCQLERAAMRALEEMTEFVAVLGFEGMVIETPLRKHVPEIRPLAPSQYAQLMKEAADVVVCLYRVADLLGQDLHAEIDRVMQINRGRQWVRDGKGCGYHVKSPTLKLPSLDVRVSVGDIAPAPSNFGAGDYFEVKPDEILARECASVETGAAGGFTPRTEVSEVAPAYFDDETETLPASELAELKQRVVDFERWEGLLRDGLERVLRALFGADVAARAVGDIGTDSFEAVMQAVREQAEYAKAWCTEAGGSEIATARLKDRAEVARLREKSVRAELRSIADRIRTGFAGGEHAAADAILRALADLP